MLNSLKNLFKFLLNPLTDDWNGGISLVRLTFIAVMYGVYKDILNNRGIDWTILLIILFILIYLCFKGEAPQLISKLFDTIGTLKTQIPDSMMKKAETFASAKKSDDDNSN